MNRRKIRLTRKPNSVQMEISNKGEAQGCCASQSRQRIQVLVDDYNEINTKADIRAAESRGIPFSHEGFASWCGVGTNTLRQKNGDLYELLKERLTYLERVAGRPLRGHRSKDADPSDKNKEKREKKVSDEMKALQQELGRERALRLKGEEEILRLIGLLRSALHTTPT